MQEQEPSLGVTTIARETGKFDEGERPGWVEGLRVVERLLGLLDHAELQKRLRLEPPKGNPGLPRRKLLHRYREDHHRGRHSDIEAEHLKRECLGDHHVGELGKGLARAGVRPEPAKVGGRGIPQLHQAPELVHEQVEQDEGCEDRLHLVVVQLVHLAQVARPGCGLRRFEVVAAPRDTFKPDSEPSLNEEIAQRGQQFGEGRGQVGARLPDDAVDCERFLALGHEVSKIREELLARRLDGFRRHGLDEPAVIGRPDIDEVAGTGLCSGEEALGQQQPVARNVLGRDAPLTGLDAGVLARDLEDGLVILEEEVLITPGEGCQGYEIGEHHQHVVGDLVGREPMGEVAILEQGRQVNVPVVVKGEHELLVAVHERLVDPCLGIVVEVGIHPDSGSLQVRDDLVTGHGALSGQEPRDRLPVGFLAWCALFRHTAEAISASRCMNRELRTRLASGKGALDRYLRASVGFCGSAVDLGDVHVLQASRHVASHPGATPLARVEGKGGPRHVDP